MILGIGHKGAHMPGLFDLTISSDQSDTCTSMLLQADHLLG